MEEEDENPGDSDELGNEIVALRAQMMMNLKPDLKKSEPFSRKCIIQLVI